MKKDFITVTPDSGTGNATVTVVASENSGQDERSASLTISGGSINRTIQITQKMGKVDFVELLSGEAISKQVSDGGYVEINRNAGTSLLTVEKDGAKLHYQDPDYPAPPYEGIYNFVDLDNLDVIAKQMGYDSTCKIPFCVYRIRMRIYKGKSHSVIFTIGTPKALLYSISYKATEENIIFKLFKENDFITDSSIIPYNSENYFDFELYAIAAVGSETSSRQTPVIWMKGINFCIVSSSKTYFLFKQEDDDYTDENFIVPCEMFNYVSQGLSQTYNSDSGVDGIPISIIDDPSFNRMYFTNKTPIEGEELPE